MVLLLMMLKSVIWSNRTMTYSYSKGIFFLLDWQVMCEMTLGIMRIFYSPGVSSQIVFIAFLDPWTMVIFYHSTYIYKLTFSSSFFFFFIMKHFLLSTVNKLHAIKTEQNKCLILSFNCWFSGSGIQHNNKTLKVKKKKYPFKVSRNFEFFNSLQLGQTSSITRGIICSVADL